MNDSKFEWNKHNPPKHGTEKLCVRSHNKCNNLPLLSKWNVQCYDESACTNCTHVFSLDSDEITTSKCAASLWVKCKVFFTVLNENKSNRRLNDHDHRNNVLDSHWPDNTQTHDGLSLITHTLFWFHRQKITNRSNESNEHWINNHNEFYAEIFSLKLIKIGYQPGFFYALFAENRNSRYSWSGYFCWRNNQFYFSVRNEIAVLILELMNEYWAQQSANESKRERSTFNIHTRIHWSWCLHWSKRSVPTWSRQATMWMYKNTHIWFVCAVFCWALTLSLSLQWSPSRS